MHLTVFSNHNEQFRFEFHLKSKIPVTRCIEWRVRVRISKFDSNLKRNSSDSELLNLATADESSWVTSKLESSWSISNHGAEFRVECESFSLKLRVSKFSNAEFTRRSLNAKQLVTQLPANNFESSESSFKRFTEFDSDRIIQSVSEISPDLSNEISPARSFQWNRFSGKQLLHFVSWTVWNRLSNKIRHTMRLEKQLKQGKNKAATRQV